MATSVVADFQAEALYDDTYRPDPKRCRVLLSEDRLVVASDGRRTAIGLSSIFDVIVSRIPKDLADFFDQTILVGYVDGRARRTIIIKGEHARIDKFALYLYKATLQGTGAQVKHPARRGGRVVDGDVVSARVTPTPHAVLFKGRDLEFEIDLSVITDVDHVRRDVEGTSRPVVSIRHMDDGQAVTTEIYHDSIRKLNILARYLRLRYFQLETKLEAMDVSNPETEALITLYSGGDPEHLEAVLDSDGPAVEEVLNGLVEKDLVADTESGSLTSQGQMIVASRIDDVNV